MSVPWTFRGKKPVQKPRKNMFIASIVEYTEDLNVEGCTPAIQLIVGG